MHDDESMDALLTEAMPTDEPRLSLGFDSRVLRAVRPRRLRAGGRLVMIGYALGAAASTAWCMHDLPLTWIALAIAVTVPVAAGLSAYGRRLAFGA
jgi:hypothetical protein